MKLTPEQIIVLQEEGSRIAAMAEAIERGTDQDVYQLRLALAARRIAEIVMPQDLRYTVSAR